MPSAQRKKIMGNSNSGAIIHDAEQKQRKLQVLKKVDDFPITLRQTIADAKEEDAEIFLSIVEKRLVDILYGNEGRGLDCDRDTEVQVETAITLFPQALGEEYWGIHPPIYAQLAYLKSAPFIPILAELGIKANQFQEEERGGLFYREWNVLRSLVNDDWREWYDEDDEHQQKLVEANYMFVIRSLQRMGILRKEDIADHGLLREMFSRHSFREEAFRCLVDWNPNCFKESCTVKGSNTHSQLSIYRESMFLGEIRIFRTVFELGMLHYPAEIAFLFHRESDGRTPFDMACERYGIQNVFRIVRDALAIRDNQNFDSSTEVWMADALINAASNPAVHLDGVYFLFRREPGWYCSATVG
mmetsp:Transcript_16013/g.44277  ORF Transcript_16013/g.44277 Transcript_16013/m.44277 type:complete len:358 (+) Transcript_16013:133-1206(+)